MTTRVSPTEGIRAEIDELIAGAQRGSWLEHFEEVARAACGWCSKPLWKRN